MNPAASKIIDVAGRTAGLTNEITEREKAEQALRESQALYYSLIEQLPAGIFRKDAEGRYVLVNSWFCRLRGKTPDELLKKTPAELAATGTEKDGAIQLLIQGANHHEQIMKTGQPMVTEEQYPGADGEVRHLHVMKSPVYGPDGSVVGSQGILMDITETKRAQEALQHSEEQLQHSQKMEAVGQLAGGVAHDFNNLLTVINGYCAMALQKKEEVQPILKNIEEIQKAADRATSLTSQLLAFSRKQVLQPRVLQLNEVVRGIEKMLRRLIGEDVELSTTFDSALGNVKADPGQIEQVIMNLAVNARDAMPRGGKLTISTSNTTIDQETQFHNRTLEVGEYVMLAISDNGVGMTEEVKTHLFEPFFTTKGIGKGTGLGLATCYGIICQSGGDIRVYSEPNSGTTFKIYLPRTDATLDMVSIVDLETLPAGTESILVVEDDLSVRELAVIILRKCGYHVQESNNAFEALRLIKRNPRYDLVVTDVIMPQMSGKDLHDQIKSQLPQIKVLLMSGYADDALAHHGVLDEGFSFLGKPFSPAKLARKVREVLDAPATTRQFHLNGSRVSMVR